MVAEIYSPLFTADLSKRKEETKDGMTFWRHRQDRQKYRVTHVRFACRGVTASTAGAVRRRLIGASISPVCEDIARHTAV